MNIQNKAVLVALTVKAPTGNKKDKAATAVVVSEFDTAQNAGNFSKSLYGDELKEYGTVRSRLKEWFASATLPWGEDGVRILPTAKILEAREKLQAFEGLLLGETNKIMDAYSEIRAQAKDRLGGLFSESDYPDEEKLRAKFGMEVRYYPLPQEGDFRVDLGEAEKQAMETELKKALKETMDQGLKDLWGRLHERVSKMAEILGREKGSLKDDYISRTYDLCQSLKDLNLWQDQKLSDMVKVVEEKLCQYTETALQNPATKATLASQVDTVMDAMAGFMGGGGNMGFIQAPKLQVRIPEIPKNIPSSTYSLRVVNGNVVHYQK